MTMSFSQSIQSKQFIRRPRHDYYGMAIYGPFTSMHRYNAIANEWYNIGHRSDTDSLICQLVMADGVNASRPCFTIQIIDVNYKIAQCIDARRRVREGYQQVHVPTQPRGTVLTSDYCMQKQTRSPRSKVGLHGQCLPYSKLCCHWTL